MFYVQKCAFYICNIIIGVYGGSRKWWWRWRWGIMHVHMQSQPEVSYCQAKLALSCFTEEPLEQSKGGVAMPTGRESPTNQQYWSVGSKCENGPDQRWWSCYIKLITAKVNHIRVAWPPGPASDQWFSSGSDDTHDVIKSKREVHPLIKEDDGSFHQ